MESRRSLQLKKGQRGDSPKPETGVWSMRSSGLLPRAAVTFGALRLFVGVVLKSIYRLDVDGRERVPNVGPALLVANHVTFIDTLFIGLIAGRPVRFVMHRRYYELPIAKWAFRALGCIPITSGREDKACLQQALDEVDITLANDGLVCIFPEGSLTKDGTLGPFRSGVERVVARRPVPVIPIAMSGLWRSIFSRNPNTKSFSAALDRLGARVRIMVGEPLAPHGLQVAALRHHIARLATQR